MTSYVIRAALHEEANEGWVWQGEFPSRTIVEISRKVDGKTCSVFCQTRKIDKNFQDTYNQSANEKKRLKQEDKNHRIDIDLGGAKETLVMGEWYRTALGRFDTTEADNKSGLVELKITACAKGWKRWWGPFRAAAHHPDIVVRLGTRLGVLGLGLGIVGLMPALLEVACIPKNCQHYLTLLGAVLVIILGWWICRPPKLVRPE